MKTQAICSFFVLFAIVAGIVATTPAAFADHSEVTITTGPVPLGYPLCEETNECYTPGNATVDVGGKVIMTNIDATKQLHTFSSGTVEGYTGTLDGKFDSGLLTEDQSFEWIAGAEGEYPYYCTIHTWMQGMIIVQEAEAQEQQQAVSGGMVDDNPDLMMDENPSATGMLSDGTMVSIWTTKPTAGEVMEISIEFANAEHVNHDIRVTQNGNEVMYDTDAHNHDGNGKHTTGPLGSSDPVDVTVTFQGYGVNDPKTGPIGEQVAFTNVVPEFGTIAMMILAVAIISTIAITAKSRVIPRL